MSCNEYFSTMVVPNESWRSEYNYQHFCRILYPIHAEIYSSTFDPDPKMGTLTFFGRFSPSILKSSMVPPLVQTVFFEGQAPHCFDLCFSYHNIACTTVYDTSIDAEYSKVHWYDFCNVCLRVREEILSKYMFLRYFKSTARPLHCMILFCISKRALQCAERPESD